MTEPRAAGLAVALALLVASIATPTAGQPKQASGRVERPTTPELDALAESAVAAKPGKGNAALVRKARLLAARFERERNPDNEARSWQLAGYFSMLSGDNIASAGYSDRALSICRRIGDFPCVTRTAINGAVAHKRAGQLTTALERLQLAVEVAKRTGETKRAEQARYNLANVRHSLGDVQGALATFDQLARDYPNSQTALGSLLTAARIYVELGQSRLAVSKADEALALLKRNNDVSGWTTDALTTAQSTAGLAYALAGDQRRATDHLDRALSRANGSDADDERFDVNSRYAWAWQLLNRPDRALPYTRAAYALRGEVEEPDRIDFLERAATVFEAGGENRLAGQARQEALRITRRLQGEGLQTATASAVARVGLGERDMLVSKLRLDQAVERARLDRTRLIAVSILAVVLLIAGAVIARLRWAQLKRSQAAVLAERTRVARDLHDTLIQGFTGITLQLQQAARAAPAGDGGKNRLDALARSAATSLVEARNAVWQMRSEAVERGDLRSAIEEWLGTVEQNEAKLSFSGNGVPARLDQNLTEDLLRFVQEAVTNALRHAHARKIEIIGRQPTAHSFELTVIDDGRGFDADAAPAGHWGLQGMRERVERSGGTFSLSSSPGSGTRVSALVEV